MPDPICYCFNYSSEDIQQDWEFIGHSNYFGENQGGEIGGPL